MGIYFNISTEGEVLPEWMSFEAVVSEDPPQVGMVGEEHAVHVPNFTFVPVGGLVNIIAGLDGCQFVGVSFHSDA